MCPEKGALSRGKIIFQPLFYSGVASRGDTNVSSQLHLLRTILLGYFCRKKIPNLPSRWASTSYKWSPSINGLINDGYLGVLTWVFPKIGEHPQNGWWKSWKTLFKWMIWGEKLFFLETSTLYQETKGFPTLPYRTRSSLHAWRYFDSSPWFGLRSVTARRRPAGATRMGFLGIIIHKIPTIIGLFL